MKLTDIDKLIKCLEAQPSSQLDERVDALLGSLPVTVLPRTRRTILQSRTTRLALAAVVLLAVIVGIPEFIKESGNSRLWARALKNTRNLGNYSFKYTRIERDLGIQEDERGSQETAMWYVWKDRGIVIERYTHGELDHKTYVLYGSDELILVYPTTKEYERRPLLSSYRSETPKEMALWLLDGNYTELGEKTINDRVYVGIENRRDPDTLPEGVDKWHQEIWFDTETLLPASMEISFVNRDSNSSCMIQQNQFQYGVEFHADLLDPHIPDNYMRTVVGGLRLFSELKGGKYPRILDRLVIKQEVGDRAEVESAIEVNSPLSGNYGYDALMRTVNFYYMVVSKSRDFVYYGDRVTAKDSNRILLYWWNNFGQDYQVIWGDLRVESLTKDQLIDRCYLAGDSVALLDILEKDDGKNIPAIAEYLEQIGEVSSISALLRHADRWYDRETDNPFMKTVEAIRQRQERQNPLVTLVAGRLLYANGKSVTNGLIRIGTHLVSSDRDGYFVMTVPLDDSHTEHLGYAFKWTGTNARLFLWRKADQLGSLTVVLEWASSIQGRVVNQEGAPQNNIVVGLSTRLGGEAGRMWPDGNRTRTDARGHFIIEKVPTGASLELIIENPDESHKPVRVPIDEIEPEHQYDMGDIVLIQ
ncbi:MAG: carboxypeptidase regulatory-like domain-containing protein [Planctomycetes bacterium]|nr:carboxypeptidase regulatory-like domain-containing protein [Planctomycetota bacterium]